MRPKKFSQTGTFVLRNVRAKGLSHAGGVALYVKSSLDCTSRLDLCVTEQEYEAVWTEIKIQNLKVFYTVAHTGIPILTFLNLLNI